MKFSWGGLFAPKKMAAAKPAARLRVLCFGSTVGGLTLLEALKQHPQVQLVGVVTDAADDPQAKISVKVRIWRLFTLQQRKMWVSRIKASARKAGVPAYTGPVKTPEFKALLAQWQPDVIVMFVFGQMFDRDIIQAPPCGVFNFHPSHLSAGKGKGPQPYEEAMACGDDTVRMSVHHVTEAVDSGEVVLESPPVSIRQADGRYAEVPAIHAKVAADTVATMTRQLVAALLPLKEAGPEHQALKPLSVVWPVDQQRRLMQPVPTGVPLPKPTRLARLRQRLTPHPAA
jgi:methionyl-tRNA formyltransferase